MDLDYIVIMTYILSIEFLRQTLYHSGKKLFQCQTLKLHILILELKVI